MKEPVEIRVHGCVASQGRYKLQCSVTVGEAVSAAGGFGGQGMRPTGIIAVRSRRKSDGRYYQRRTLDFVKDPCHLEVQLKPGDFVLVQFDVDSWSEK